MLCGGFERGRLFVLFSGSRYYIFYLPHSGSYIWCWGLLLFRCVFVCEMGVRGCCGVVASGWGVMVVVCVRAWAIVVMWVVVDAVSVCSGVVVSWWKGLVGGVME